jgi:hypothetical protein
MRAPSRNFNEVVGDVMKAIDPSGKKTGGSEQSWRADITQAIERLRRPSRGHLRIAELRTRLDELEKALRRARTAAATFHSVVAFRFFDVDDGIKDLLDRLDSLTVNRKYRDQWTGKLPSRLHIISNELPKLFDASTAVVGRIVLLMLTRSWLGIEDHDLERRLQSELPAILNWSLDGLERLTGNDGKFTRVPSADDAIVQMRDLASPVSAFAREKCIISADSQVDVDTLYASYKTWCELNEHRKDSMQMFSRNLRAVAPGVRKVRARDGDARHHTYVGIGQKP